MWRRRDEGEGAGPKPGRIGQPAMGAPGRAPKKPRPANKRARRKRLVSAVLGMAGLTYAVYGFLNDNYIRTRWPDLFVDSVFASRYTEIFVIVAFGAWRVWVEKNAQTRRRIATVVFLVAMLWGVVPMLLPFAVPSVGTLPFTPEFPSVHVPGAITYFVWLGLMFFFGRRVDCSWCCPCVGIRETAGQPFRQDTIRGPTAWALRHVKWVFVAVHLAYVGFIFVPGLAAEAFFNLFWIVMPISYFASLLIVPWTGNRNYCRYVCPWGATYGAISKVGFFKIKADADRCMGCAKCDLVCDMGVPVMQLVKEKGVVNVVDCVGCGRCADACPADVLELHDVRDSVRGLLGKGRDRGAAKGSCSVGSGGCGH